MPYVHCVFLSLSSIAIKHNNYDVGLHSYRPFVRNSALKINCQVIGQTVIYSDEVTWIIYVIDLQSRTVGKSGILI